tara:strand:- start:29 stop:481 length:453 start_codon:yes stop_codon:yes gene_type:complete
MADINYTVKFPLTFESEEPGHDSIGSDRLIELIHFNMKNILLCCAGERTFDEDFGACLAKFVFEPMTQIVADELKYTVEQQLESYLPYVYINNVSVVLSEEESMFLAVRIEFTVAQINLTDVLEISLEQIVGSPFATSEIRDLVTDYQGG